MKKNDGVYVKATVDATRTIVNTRQIRVKIGDTMIWVSPEDIIENNAKDESKCS